MNGFFHIIYHKKEQDVCFKMIPHMCRLVLMSGFYEELSVPTPHSRNAYFFITRLYIICQKPKFRQCYFLVNIKNIKIDILGHILVPVSDGTGGRTGYHHISPRLKGSTYVNRCHLLSSSSEIKISKRKKNDRSPTSS